MLRSTKGRLLIALPELRDPNFDRTIVLMVEHDTETIVGVVLNRPSETALSEAAPTFADLAGAPGVVFIGGPVATDGVLALGRTTGVGEDAVQLVTGEVGVVDLECAADVLRAEVRDLRLFSGVASWAPGQLEGELAAGAWLVVDVGAVDILGPDPESLWVDVLRTQRGRIAGLADYPPEPIWN